MKRQDNPENRTVRSATANFQFSTQFGHILSAFKHTYSHPCRFGGFEGLEELFTNELFAHPVACVLYFNYGKIILPHESNPNLAVPCRGFDSVLNEMANNPFKTRRVCIHGEACVLYFKNWLRFSNGLTFHRFL